MKDLVKLRVKAAYNLGYRVSDKGVVTHNGKPVTVTRSVRSCTIYVSTPDGFHTNLAVDKLAAYCFFGEDALQPDTYVRSKNGDKRVCTKANLYLSKALSRKKLTKELLKLISNFVDNYPEELTTPKEALDQLRQTFKGLLKKPQIDLLIEAERVRR